MTEQKESAIELENITVRVRPIDPSAAGFLPRYRALLSAQRAFTNPAKATPEDIDGAQALLSEHILEPESAADKLKILNSVSGEELMKIFNALMGTATVPPAKGAA
jgi:hypothetical protein